MGGKRNIRHGINRTSKSGFFKFPLCMSEQEPGSAASGGGEQRESGGGDRHPEGPHGLLPRGQAHPGQHGGGRNGGDAANHHRRRRRRGQLRVTVD